MKVEYRRKQKVKIYCGDAVDVLTTLPPERVHCCVTSPPYFQLRDYGVEGQIGVEESPERYIARLVAVFREVRRVLRPDGTFWLNIGDSYAGGKRGRADSGDAGRFGGPVLEATRRAIPEGLKPKDLIGIPWRLALALQADGWCLRSEIIWHKPNPMPESVKDRPTKTHEQIFLLTKSQRYFYDADAIKEPTQDYGSSDRGHNKKNGATGQAPDSGFKSENYAECGRNKRSVWKITPKPFKGAHFAVFPPELPETCILAGTPEGGIVLDPFNGSGTTGIVAVKHGRSYVGIELNPDYVEISKRRFEQECGFQIDIHGDCFKASDDQLIAKPSFACVIAVCGAPMNVRSEQEYEQLREEILACAAREIAA